MFYSSIKEVPAIIKEILHSCYSIQISSLLKPTRQFAAWIQTNWSECCTLINQFNSMLPSEIYTKSIPGPLNRWFFFIYILPLKSKQACPLYVLVTERETHPVAIGVIPFGESRDGLLAAARSVGHVVRVQPVLRLLVHQLDHTPVGHLRNTHADPDHNRAQTLTGKKSPTSPADLEIRDAHLAALCIQGGCRTPVDASDSGADQESHGEREQGRGHRDGERAAGPRGGGGGGGGVGLAFPLGGRGGGRRCRGRGRWPHDARAGGRGWSVSCVGACAVSSRRAEGEGRSSGGRAGRCFRGDEGPLGPPRTGLHV